MTVIKDLADRVLSPKRWKDKVESIKSGLPIEYYIRRVLIAISSLIIKPEFTFVNKRDFNVYGLNAVEFEFSYRYRERGKTVTSFLTAFIIPQGAQWTLEEFDHLIQSIEIESSSSGTEFIIPPGYIDVRTGDPLYGLIEGGKEIKEIRYDEPEEQFGLIALDRLGAIRLLNREDLREVDLDEFSSVVQVPILVTGGKFSDMLEANKTLGLKKPSCGILQLARSRDTYIIYPCRIKYRNLFLSHIPLEVFEKALDSLAKSRNYRFAVLETGRVGFVIHHGEKSIPFGVSHMRNKWIRVKCHK